MKVLYNLSPNRLYFQEIISTLCKFACKCKKLETFLIDFCSAICTKINSELCRLFVNGNMALTRQNRVVNHLSRDRYKVVYNHLWTKYGDYIELFPDCKNISGIF